ncbi:MAG: hypothetical protein Q9165_003331 [Trypethelium subeluteriae]
MDSVFQQPHLLTLVKRQNSIFNGSTSLAQDTNGQTVGALLTSIVTGLILFSIQIAAFLLLRIRFTRLYEPKTYLVPKRERMPIPPRGLFGWLITVFSVSNAQFVQRCGLDAYMFLRFLRMLLKIFIPLALVILPILLPINKTGGGGARGLDAFAMGNVVAPHQGRLWAHLILAVCVAIWACYVFQQELRSYIRMRQAYLTSPQHRLRASATTVLVTNIPRKWLTFEALDGLYDVFPGGIRNIWINRNYDELQEKVTQRDNVAHQLESAETELIRNAVKAHSKQVAKETQKSKSEKKKDTEEANHQAEEIARSGGATEGAHEMVDMGEQEKPRLAIPIPRVKEGLEAFGSGAAQLPLTLGRGIGTGIGTVRKGVNERFDAANAGGLATTYDSPVISEDTFAVDDDQQPLAQKSTTSRAQVANLDKRAEAENLRLVDTGRTKASEIADLSSMQAGQPNTRPAHALPAAPTSPIRPQKSKVARVLPWKPDDTLNPPSPQPHERISDELFGSDEGSMTNNTRGPENKSVSKSKVAQALGLDKGASKDTEYPEAFDPDFDENAFGEPVWKKYIKEKDRPTMRLPIASWMFSLPLIGKKIDTIHYCRRELARLNAEIEKDQSEPEKFPLMNSAFIQFNHQAAAHMACQSLSHHVPKNMAPRRVEISPQDVLWDNLSVKWWEQYSRSSLVFLSIVALIFLFLIPVTFASAISQISTLQKYSWLSWITRLPPKVVAGVTGVLPQLLLGLCLILVPLIVRLLANLQGMPTGSSVELSIQIYYFLFLFIQVFLVVSISSGILGVIQQLTNNPTSVTDLLATRLPGASNFFFSYLILQALSISAGQLVQLLHLFLWFIWAPINDSTARQKFHRQVNLPSNKGGTLFPVYTNFACIGLIYSVISPLIMVFNLITFSLFWIAHRYNALFVYQYRNDTGGLLFPKAINQLFTGLYVMDLCMIGLFFIQRDGEGHLTCVPQASIMIAVMVLTALYQILLNQAFAPMFEYMPITLEDDAVRRDEEFARAHDANSRLVDGAREEEEDIEDALRHREEREAEQDHQAEKAEQQEFHAHHTILHPSSNLSEKQHSPERRRQHHHPSWADRSQSRDRSRTASPAPRSRSRDTRGSQTPLQGPAAAAAAPPPITSPSALAHPAAAPTQLDGKAVDIESQNPVGDILYSGYHDALEDLTPDQRDALVRQAFQHQALRARRPIIWLPRDVLGISDYEIRVTRRLSSYLGISNDGTALDAKGRVVFRKSPPDFSDKDLIDL